MRSILREKLMDKYFLYDGKILTIEEIQRIKYSENYTIKELIYLLGLYKGIVYNKNVKYSRININRYSSVKDNVKLILLDLKYLKEYGSRSYSCLEIKEICKKYNIALDDFLKYSSHYISSYNDNIEIISKNKLGLWIGEKPYLSNDFILKNYEKLKEGLNKVCNNFVIKYNCYFQKDDLYFVGKEAILTNGQIERNFSFDEERIFSKLFFRAKYAMLDYMIENYKYINNENTVIPTEQVDIYHYEEEEYLYKILANIQFDIFENIILEEFIINLEEIIINRELVLKKISYKLRVNLEMVKENIASIQEKIIKENNVKVCKNKKVVLNIE